MTVNTISSVAEFDTNGVTTNYPFYFKFLANEDLVVTYVDPLGVSSTLALGTHYSVNGAGSDVGGSIVTTSALAGPGQLVVSREMEAFQQTSLRNQGKFLAETHEDVFDRLTMLIQQGLAIFARALKRPFGRDYFYAENRRITSLQDPVDLQDAATRNWSEVYLGGLVSGLIGNPNLASGVGYVTPRGALGVVQDMANTADPLKGAGYIARAIRHINSNAELRALLGQYDGEVVYLRGRAAANTLGSGQMVWVAGSALADNDGTVFGSEAAGRWVRPGTDRTVDASWFGVGNDGSNYTANLQAAINFAGLAAGGGQGMIVVMPRGVVGVSATINIPNRVGLLGANGRGTILRALAGFTGQYMISATNGASSMFASWCRDIHIDARGTNFTAVVYTTGWQETCGMQRVVVQADGTTSNGVLYEVGAGGAAMWEVLDCEIFIDSAAATRNGIRVNQVSSVGGFVLSVRNTTIAGSVTNQLSRGVYMVNDTLIADLLHIEYVGVGVLAGVAGNLDVRSMTGSGNNVTTMIAFPSGHLGAYSISALLPNGATNAVVNNTTGITLTGRIGHLAGPAKAPTTLWTGTAASGSVVMSRAIQSEEMVMFGINSTYAGMQQATMFAVRGTTYNVSFGANASAVIALSADGLTVTVNAITAGFALDRVQVRTPGYFGV